MTDIRSLSHYSCSILHNNMKLKLIYTLYLYITHSKRASAQCAFPSTCFHIQVMAAQQKSEENKEEVWYIRNEYTFGSTVKVSPL